MSQLTFDVVIIEDDPAFTEIVQRHLARLAARRTGRILVATNRAEVENILNTEMDQVRLVVLDGNIPDGKDNFVTVPIVDHLADAGYRGVILATSSDGNIRRQMIERAEARVVLVEADKGAQLRPALEQALKRLTES